MIYLLQAPLDLAPFPEIFAGLPPPILGIAIWMFYTVLALVYAYVVKGAAPLRFLGIPLPLLFAAAISTGLFINTYNLVDEVSVNLEHSYNLYHYGKFSMSPERWIDGTVEPVYYLLHVPFAWSQRSLILANYLISLLVGLLHLPLAAYALDPEAGPRKRTLQLCAFALCLPLTFTFSSGFGNGLVSLIFLAAIGSALNGRESRSLVLSGLLPLFRPDALLLSVVNGGVIIVSRRLAGKRLLAHREHALLLLLPTISAGLYYLFYRVAFGHWVPTPLLFKAIRWPMFAMTEKALALRDVMVYFSQGAHAVTVTCILLILIDVFLRRPVGARLTGDTRVLSLSLYAMATMPLLLFYSVAHRTLGDFSGGTHARYWVALDLTLQLLVLTLVGNVDLSWGARDEKGGSQLLPWRQHAGLVAFLCLSVWFTLTNPNFKFNRVAPGRTDSVFAGAFTEKYLPLGLTVSTTEMNTFGLMIERPVIDLWGYTAPAIALSGVCNGDRIRSNGQHFLELKPDVYWPYWFTYGPIPVARWNFDTVEDALAVMHHTSKQGNLLGDMSQVLAEYDVVMIQTKWNQLAYLVRKSARWSLVESLVKRGFSLSRQRDLDLARFHKLYDRQLHVTYPCR